MANANARENTNVLPHLSTNISQPLVWLTQLILTKMAQSFHEQGGPAGTPAQLQIDPYHAVDSEALPDRVYIMQNVDTDVDVEELQQRIQLEPWFKAEGFDQRDGITLAGGSLLGVTTALATVKDKWGSEVGESGTLEDAERLIPFLPKEGEPYTAQVVWDSEEALNMSNAFLRYLDPPQTREINEDAKGSELREDKRQLHVRVSDSISALARGYEEADRVRGCFFCSDFFCLPQGQIKEFAANPASLTEFRKKIARREPVNIMQSAMEASAGAKLVMLLPIGGLSVQEIRRLVPAIRQLFPSRVLVIVHANVGRDSASLSYKMMAAITRCGKHPPRRALVAVVSGGLGVLAQMAFCAKHGLRLIVLDGSGRLSDLWGSIWHERASSRFDPVVQQQRLSRSFCYQADEAAVDMLHVVLNCGELVIHPVANSAAALERLCIQQLLGDPLLVLADGQCTRYENASARYEWPRMLLTNASIILALISTVLAILVAEDERSSAAFYLCIILPSLLMVVDQVEVYLGTSIAAHAVERARGLVEQQTFMYRTRVAGYSDAVLARQIKEIATNGGAELTDVETKRQQLFTRRLNEIDEAVSAAGAVVDVVHATDRGRIGPSEGVDGALLRPRSLAAGGDVIDGDEYIRQRVDPHVKRSSRAARRLLFFSLVARLGLFVTAAVGTAIATLGYTKYVAVTVAVSTALTRWLNTTRVEARRSAHSRAASALSGAKLAWTALPREMRSRQAEIDQLVLRVESLLERTLPPDDLEASQKSKSAGADQEE